MCSRKATAFRAPTFRPCSKIAKAMSGWQLRMAWTASANSPYLHFQSGKVVQPIHTSVHAAKEGGVWLGTSDGVNRWTNEHLTIYRRRDGSPVGG